MIYMPLGSLHLRNKFQSSTKRTPYYKLLKITRFSLYGSSYTSIANLGVADSARKPIVRLSGGGFIEPYLVSHEGWKPEDGRTIGSSSACWVTLPDLNLPPIMGKLIRKSNHTLLYEVPKGILIKTVLDAEWEKIPSRRVDGHPFEIGGFMVLSQFEDI